MKTFVTFSRDSSRFCESCVGLSTCLYVVTLNWLWKYPRVIDRTSFLCGLTHTEAGGRVNPLSPGVVFFNLLSIIVVVPSNLPPLPSRHFDIKQMFKKRKKETNTREVVTITENNSETLGLSRTLLGGVITSMVRHVRAGMGHRN